MKEQMNIQTKVIEKYWIDKISGMNESWALGADWKSGSPEGKFEFSPAPDLVKRVKEIARDNVLSEQVIYMVFFGILLYKYYKMPGFLIATPSTKNTESENNRPPFLFYKIAIEPGDTIKKLLGRTLLEFQESQGYGEFDFNRLVVNAGEKGCHHELICRFGLRDYRIHGESASFEKVELQFHLQEKQNNGILIRFVSHLDQYENEYLAPMATHYLNLLQYAVSGLDKEIGELTYLDSREREQLLYQFNNMEFDYPREKTVVTLFQEQVDKSPDHVAIRFEGRDLNYRELNEQVNCLAFFLMKNHGVGSSCLVALIMERSPMMVVALLGILKAGAGYLPLSPDFPEERFAYLLSDSAVQAILMDKDIWQDKEKTGYARVICLDQEWDNIMQLPVSNPEVQSGPGDMAYVIYTSGSTGKPKGVVIDHKNLVRLFVNDGFQFSFGPDDTWTLFHSLWFDFSVWEIFGSLLYGARLVVVPMGVIRTPAVFAQLLVDEKVTVLNQIPSIFNNLASEILKAQTPPALSLRYIIFGGEALNPVLLKPWRTSYPNISLINMYGITETTVHVTFKEICEKEIKKGRSNIGGPIPTLTCYITGPKLQPEPAGIGGEITVGGDGVGRGYLNRPELTWEKFVESPFVPNQRLYRSGDLGRRLHNGDLEYLGRMDTQVKIRGYRIECGEIESKLAGMDSVKEVVVTARKDKGGENYLAAYYTSEEKMESRIFREYLQQWLPDYMIPAYFVCLERFPVTGTGKIDKNALPDPSELRIVGEGYVAPRNELETILVKIWQEVLGVDSLGVTDNFFNLGGNSIKGIHVVNRIQEWLEEILHVTVLFEAPTIEELAAKLETYRTGTGSVVDDEKIKLMRQLITPPLPIQTKVKKNPRAIFILAPPRSGTTLLRVILAGHKRLFVPPELELLSFASLKERREKLSGKFGYFKEGTLRAIMEIKKCDAHKALEIMESLEEQDLSVAEFYGTLQEWLGEKILVDKTPWYALDLSVLKRAEEYFQDPIYIHLLRNPYAVIHSFEKAKLDQIFRYPNEFTARELGELVWYLCNNNILEFLKGIPGNRKHTVRFEELVGEPETVTMELCRFLDFDFKPGMVDIYQNTGEKMLDGIHADSKMLGDIKFLTHKRIDPGVMEKWKKDYTQEFLGPKTESLALSLGYKEKRAVMDYSTMESAGQADYYELSFAQRRLWILCQIPENRSAYNMPAAYILEGKLDSQALEKAYRTLIHRHESLRTAFIMVKGEPKQKIIDPGDIDYKLEYINLAGAKNPQAKNLEIANREAETPFDLKKAPLVRTKLIALHEKKHVLLFTLHHIICDGWSIRLLVNELSVLYNAYKEGKEFQLPALKFQYKDFALWQNLPQGLEAMKQQEGYWLDVFKDEPPRLNLPLDFKRPPVQSFEGENIGFELDTNETGILKKLGLQEETTLFMILSAVFSIFLSKVTGGMEDLVVGTGIAGRGHPETRKIIGMFVNTLAIRYRPCAEKTFMEFLKETRTAILNAFDNQDYPFESLVEKVVKQRDRSRNPLVDVVFMLQNMESEPGQAKASQDRGLKMNLYENQIKIAKFDMSFYCWELQGKLYFTLEYCTRLFQKSTIELLAKYFQEVVSAITKDPTGKLGDIVLPLGFGKVLSRVLEEDAGDFGF